MLKDQMSKDRTTWIRNILNSSCRQTLLTMETLPISLIVLMWRKTATVWAHQQLTLTLEHRWTPIKLKKEACNENSTQLEWSKSHLTTHLKKASKSASIRTNPRLEIWMTSSMQTRHCCSNHNVFPQTRHLWARHAIALTSKQRLKRWNRPQRRWCPRTFQTSETTGSTNSNTTCRSWSQPHCQRLARKKWHRESSTARIWL